MHVQLLAMDYCKSLKCSFFGPLLSSFSPAKWNGCYAVVVGVWCLTGWVLGKGVLGKGKLGKGSYIKFIAICWCLCKMDRMCLLFVVGRLQGMKCNRGRNTVFQEEIESRA